MSGHEGQGAGEGAPSQPRKRSRTAGPEAGQAPSSNSDLNPAPQRQSRKRRFSGVYPCDNDGDEQGRDDDPPARAQPARCERKRSRTMPPVTHFISIQITDPAVIGSLLLVQDAVRKRHPDLDPWMVPQSCFHISLCVLSLESPDDLQRARNVMVGLCERACALSLVGVCGVAHEQDLSFATLTTPQGQPTLERLQQTLLSSCRAAGLRVLTTGRIAPHISLLRCPASVPMQGVHEELARFRQFSFGFQECSAIKLCVATRNPVSFFPLVCARTLGSPMFLHQTPGKAPADPAGSEPSRERHLAAKGLVSSVLQAARRKHEAATAAAAADAVCGGGSNRSLPWLLHNSHRATGCPSPAP